MSQEKASLNKAFIVPGADTNKYEKDQVTDEPGLLYKIYPEIIMKGKDRLYSHSNKERYHH